jgi:predicted permease
MKIQPWFRFGGIFEQFAHDVRVGARSLVKDRSFSCIALVVLGLGIGGVMTQFTIVNTALFHLLPFPEPERLTTLKLRAPGAVERAANSNIMPADYEDFAAGQRSFAGLAGYMTAGSEWPVVIDGLPRPTDLAAVEPGFFKVLGVTPVLGRTFTADEDRPGRPLVALISFTWWQREFGGAADILDRTMLVRGQPTTIIGVMPEGFLFPRAQNVWLPLHTFMPYPPRGQQQWGMSVIGRLGPGVTREQAQAELALMAERLTREHPATNERLTRAEVVPLAADFTGTQYRRTILMLLISVGLVLVIASLNVMNLQFTRAAARAHELGVRSALGASRGRLIRQLLTESALLAAAGGAVGVVIAQWCGSVVHGMFTSPLRSSEALPSWAAFGFDRNVLLVALGVVLLAGLLSGLLPAIVATRANVASVIKGGGRTAAGGWATRLSRGFVVAQIALTGPLLFASLLMTRSLVQQRNFDFGFNAARALVTGRFYTPTAPAQRVRYCQDLLERFRADPRFDHAALTTRLSPMTPDARHLQPCEIDGRAYVQEKDRPIVLTEMISDGYFATIGLGLLQGRDITPADIANQRPVAVVNVEFVRRMLGGEPAIGRRFRAIDPANNEPGPWFTIVGVVPDFFGNGPRTSREPPPALAFEPLQTPRWAYTFVARGREPPAQLVEPLRRAFAQLPGAPTLFSADSVTGHLLAELRERRDATTLFVVFGGVAVVLATVGLYGITAFSVGQRTREFGVRMALGATTASILRDVLGRGTRQLLIGGAASTAIILVVAMAASGPITEFLYRVTPFDPLIHGAVAVLLTLATLLACWRPAIRAARTDPMRALRAE